jgi:hypothetical protein
MLFSVSRLAQIVGAFATLSSLVNAIDTITIKGRHFVNSRTGETVLSILLQYTNLTSSGSRVPMYIPMVIHTY